MRSSFQSALGEWTLRNPRGQELPLSLRPGEAATIGRELSVQVPILDAGISRHHATLTFDGQDLWLEDLHSQNGTFVNAERVHSRRLRSGDVITLGRVSLILQERRRQDDDEEASKVLARLSTERLVGLVRGARELSSIDSDETGGLRRLLHLAMEAVTAERGAVLLWDEEKNALQTVTAVPLDFFQAVSRLLPLPLVETVLQGGKAHLLRSMRASTERASGGGGLRGLEETQAGGSTAVAVPLLLGGRPLGILYLERESPPGGFQAVEADYLAAFAWVASPALSAFSKGSNLWEPLRPRAAPPSFSPAPDTRNSDAEGEEPALPAARQASSKDSLGQLLGALEGFFSRTAAVLFDREEERGAEKAGCESREGEAHAKPPSWEGEAHAEPLRKKDLGNTGNRAIGEVCTTLPERGGVGSGRRAPSRPSERAFSSTQLCLKALRRLCEKASAPLEEIQVTEALNDARRELGRVGPWRVENGGSLRVYCPAADLSLALSLVMDSLSTRSPAQGAPGCSLAATEADEGRIVLLRFRAPLAPSGPESSAPPSSEAGAQKVADDLCLRLARQIVAQNLHGELRSFEVPTELEIRLPSAAFHLHETPQAQGAETAKPLSRGTP